MRVACARRNESQASSPPPLGNSSATSRARRPATPAFEGTCIRNNQVARVLAIASIPVTAWDDEGSSKADEHADFDRRPGRYLEPRPGSFAGRLRGFLPGRD